MPKKFVPFSINSTYTRNRGYEQIQFLFPFVVVISIFISDGGVNMTCNKLFDWRFENAGTAAVALYVKGGMPGSPGGTAR